jgi:hypothetical protein
VLFGMVILASLAGLGVLGRVWWDARAVRQAIGESLLLPDEAVPDLLHRWFDVTPVEVTWTAAWEKFTSPISRYVFRTDHTVWARMHFEDWDRLAAQERAQPLRALLDRTGAVVRAGDCWPVMSAFDWDDVPQPIRAVAILGVVEYWTRFYSVGEQYEHPIPDMVQVAQAIVMSESWFEHRAVLTNPDGSRDIGMAGASAYARRVITEWYVRGLVDFTLSDDQYFNPWHAGRFVAYWFDLMIHEADGDVDLAIRAYNRGIGRARRGEGDEYLAAVRRRRRQFMQGESRSPTWNTIVRWRDDLSDTHRPRCRPGSDLSGR